MHIARIAVVLALPILAAACSSSDTESIEAVQDRVATELDGSYAEIGRKVSSVECPPELAKPEDGMAYTCTADLEEHEIRVEVTAQGGSIVSIKSLDAVYDLPKLAGDLTADVTGKVGHPVTIDCGTGLKVVPAGEKFTCQRTDPDGKKTDVEVIAKITVKDVQEP